MGARYIAVEGPIAVGKTSLATRLSEALGSRLVLEVTDENPFLERFYENPEKFAFPAQVFFLLNRYRQQLELTQLELFQEGLVADYLFEKDRIFAQLNLDADELALYDQIFAMLRARLPKPDLVVYLEARSGVLRERLARRDRSYERRIAAEYLESVSEAYRKYFHRYDDTPLLVVESSGIDFVDSREEFEDLLDEIQSLDRGARYYVPLGTRSR